VSNSVSSAVSGSARSGRFVSLEQGSQRALSSSTPPTELALSPEVASSWTELLLALEGDIDAYLRIELDDFPAVAVPALRRLRDDAGPLPASLASKATALLTDLETVCARIEAELQRTSDRLSELATAHRDDDSSSVAVYIDQRF
jgi:hypothetical protein